MLGVVERSAARKEGCICLTLYGFLYRDAQAQGRRLTLEDLDIHHAVLARKIDCPFADKCPKYRTAVEKYNHDPYGIFGERSSHQLRFF